MRDSLYKMPEIIGADVRAIECCDEDLTTAATKQAYGEITIQKPDRIRASPWRLALGTNIDGKSSVLIITSDRCVDWSP
jgi:nucleoside phosphorylase